VNLKQALMLMPGLAADSVVRILSDGPTNTSYLVRRGDELCVLRLDKPLAKELGLERIAEHDIVEATSLAGIGAKPVYFDAESGASLRRYLPGRAWSEADLHDATRLRLLANRLRDLHALPPVGNTFEPGLAARRYARQLGTAEAQNYADKANLILADLRYEPARECLCHNDLVAGNMVEVAVGGLVQTNVEAGSGLMLIDWEYAGLGDPWFDLALVAEHHQLPDELQAGFVDAYLRREVRDTEMHRLMGWRRFYHALLSLWQLRLA
jgi:thiamine kinase-like enzyme